VVEKGNVKKRREMRYGWTLLAFCKINEVETRLMGLQSRKLRKVSFKHKEA
jgi:hypothetical protein